MGMDELEDAKGEGENASAAAQPQQGAPPAETEEERNSRVDAAKAFFRAMYAGEEPPASFGQPQEEQAKSDTSTQTACRNCEAMEFSLKEAEAKQNEAETLYKRMAADFENYRRRMERQGEEAVSLGVKKAAEAMLDGQSLNKVAEFPTEGTPCSMAAPPKAIARPIQPRFDIFSFKLTEASKAANIGAIPMIKLAVPALTLRSALQSRTL